ncbi:MAG: hypothetical protein HY060_17995 [Proteobacteria bacterium]|nr:hypothetical protein [Pseudomonadota bacterium]
MTDEDMGRFLRCQVCRLAKLADQVGRDRSLARGAAADALLRVAADLLAKAHEFDGRGFRASVWSGRSHGQLH